MLNKHIICLIILFLSNVGFAMKSPQDPLLGKVSKHLILPKGHPQRGAQEEIVASYKVPFVEQRFKRTPYSYTQNDIRIHGQQLEHKFAFDGRIDELKQHMASYKKWDLKDYTGQTPLAYAAWRGHQEVCRQLVEKGADVNSQSFKEGRSILHEVVRNLDSSVIHACSFEEYRRKYNNRLTADQATGIIKVLNQNGELNLSLTDHDGKSARYRLEKRGKDDALVEYVRKLEEKQ